MDANTELKISLDELIEYYKNEDERCVDLLFSQLEDFVDYFVADIIVDDLYDDYHSYELRLMKVEEVKNIILDHIKALNFSCGINTKFGDDYYNELDELRGYEKKIINLMATYKYQDNLFQSVFDEADEINVNSEASKNFDEGFISLLNAIVDEYHSLDDSSMYASLLYQLHILFYLYIRMR